MSYMSYNIASKTMSYTDLNLFRAQSKEFKKNDFMNYYNIALEKLFLLRNRYLYIKINNIILIKNINFVINFICVKQ